MCSVNFLYITSYNTKTNLFSLDFLHHHHIAAKLTKLKFKKSKKKSYFVNTIHKDEMITFTIWYKPFKQYKIIYLSVNLVVFTSIYTETSLNMLEVYQLWILHLYILSTTEKIFYMLIYVFPSGKFICV